MEASKTEYSKTDSDLLAFWERTMSMPLKRTSSSQSAYSQARTMTLEHLAQSQALMSLQGGRALGMKSAMPAFGTKSFPKAVVDSACECTIRPRSRQSSGWPDLSCHPAKSWPAPPTSRAAVDVARRSLSPAEGQKQFDAMQNGGRYVGGNLRAVVLPSIAQLGGTPRQRRVATEVPSRLASPQVSPCNAWCIFIEWVPPASGDECEDFQYDVRVLTNNGVEDLIMRDVGRDPRAQLNGIVPGVTYYFQVRAKNKVGEGPWSMWSEGYTAPHRPVCGFGDVTNITSSMSSTSAVLCWEEPCGHGADILGYKVQYGRDPREEGELKTVTTGDRKTFLMVTDLDPNSVYYFRIKALNQTGESEWSSWTDGIATKASKPPAPTKPVLVDASTRDLLVGWSEVCSSGFVVQCFEVRVSKGDPLMEEALTLIFDCADEKSSPWTLRVADLMPNQTYYAQVRAASAIGLSPWSDVSDAMTTLPVGPEACEDLRIVSNLPENCVVDWEAPEHYGIAIERFVVRLVMNAKSTQASQFIDVDVPPNLKRGDRVSSQLCGLPPGKKIEISVMAKNFAGGSDWRSINIISVHGVPPQPEPPLITVRTSTSFQVDAHYVPSVDDYDVLPEIKHYEIRYTMCLELAGPMYGQRMWVVDKSDSHKELAGEKALCPSTEEGSLTYRRVFADLKKPGPYYFSVRAVSDCGVSPWSAVSKPGHLLQQPPAKMASPTLAGTDGPDALLIAYTPPSDLGATSGGKLQSFEMRFSRDVDLLLRTQEGDLESNEIRFVTWAAPSNREILSPTPVRAGDLLPGRTYYFQVRAISDFGAGEWSDPSSGIEVAPQRPDKPDPIRAITEGDHISVQGADLVFDLPECNGRPIDRVKLYVLGPYLKWKEETETHVEWKELSLIDIWDVSERLVDRTSPVPDASDPLSVREWTHKLNSLGTAASFKFRHMCANACGWSELSDPSNEITTPPDVPPVVLAPECYEKDATWLKVRWDAPPETGDPVSHYILEWSKSKVFDNSTFIEEIQERECLIDGLMPRTTYYFRVSAVNSCGKSEFSECSPFDGLGLAETMATCPGPPRSVSVALLEVPGEIRVNWLPPERDGGHTVSRYRVLYSLDEDMSVPGETLNKGVRNCVLRGLRPDTVYYIDVCAINKIGQGPRSGTCVKIKMGPGKAEVSIPPKTPAPPTLSWRLPEVERKRRKAEVDRAASKEMELMSELIGSLSLPLKRFGSKESYADKGGISSLGVGSFALGRVRLDSDVSSAGSLSKGFARDEKTSEGSIETKDALPSPSHRKNKGVEITVPQGAAEVSITWKCPEKYHPTKGFIYDEKVQTHAITHYSIRVLAFCEEVKDEAYLTEEHAETSDLREDVKQIRDRHMVPKDDKNILAFITNLPGRWYYASVKAFSEAGESDWSEFGLGVCTPPWLPDKVNSVQLVSRPEVGIGLTIGWKVPHGNGEPVNRFMVRYACAVEGGMEPVGEWLELATLSLDDCLVAEDATSLSPTTLGVSVHQRGSRCNWTVDGLVHASYYIFEVTAVNAVGVGLPCLSAAFRTKSVPPCRQSPVAGIPSVATCSTVTFCWEMPDEAGGEDIEAYEVRWAEVARLQAPPMDVNLVVGEGMARECVELPADQKMYTARGVYPGNAVTVAVRAKNSVGWSEWSRLPREGDEILALSALPEAPANLCDAPLLEICASKDHRPFGLMARWKCPALRGREIHRFEFRLERQTDHAASTIKLEGCGGNLLIEHSLTHKGTEPFWREGDELTMEDMHIGLEPGEPYVLRIRAVSEAGASSWDPPGIPQLAPPDLPLRPAPPTSPGQWPMTIEVRYELPACKGAPLEFCSVRHSFEREMVNEVVELPMAVINRDADSHSIMVEELPIASPDFFFQVRVRNAVGWSPWSDVSEGYCTGASKPDPVELTVSAVEFQDLTVAWIAPDGHGRPVTDYEIMICGHGEMGKLVQLVAALNGCEDQDHMAHKKILESNPPYQSFSLLADSFEDQEHLHYRFENLLGGIEYAVAARAQNMLGWSDWGEVLGPILTKTCAPDKPPPMSLIYATQTSLHFQYLLPYDNGDPIHSMTIHWHRVEGPVDRHLAMGGKASRVEALTRGEFIVRVVPEAEGGPKRAEPGELGGAGECSLDGLEPGTLYELQVSAVNETGEGNFSYPCRFICSPGRPDAPSGLRHSTLSRSDDIADDSAFVPRPPDKSHASRPRAPRAFKLGFPTLDSGDPVPKPKPSAMDLTQLPS